MTCASVEPVLEALLDGELDAAQKAGILEHLEGCPSCATQYDRLLTLQEDIRTQANYFPAPAGLRTKVLGDIRQHTKKIWPWKQLAAAAGFVMMISLGTNIALLNQRGAEKETMARDVFSAHMRSLLGTHLIEVPSSDRHTVKPWFTGKIDFAPDVKDLSSKGFRLTGGRVDYLDGRTVAAMVFQRGQHVINLFTWPSSGSAHAETSHSGYNMIQWTTNGMTFWAVSDLNLMELKQFAEQYRE